MSSSDVEMDSGPNNLAYDPDQDPEEKRDVRKKYRAIQKTTEGAFLPPKFPKIPTNSCHFRLIDQRAQPKECSAEELTAQVHAVDALFHKGPFYFSSQIST